MEKAFDIFISYSNLDRDISDGLVEKMVSYGAEVWYQGKDSKQDYTEQINEAIKKSKSFVVLLSHHSVDSIMVKNEINRALLQRKRDPSFKIVPVIIKDLSEDDEDIISLLLGSFNWLYLNEYNSYGELVSKLFDQIDLIFADDGTNESIYSAESEIEVERLDKQNALYNSYANRYLDEIFEDKIGLSVMDLGCSDAKNTIRRLKERNYSSLLGVDIDLVKIKQATSNYGSEKNSFICADILSNDFDRKIDEYLLSKGIKGFDLIHIASVLLHLKEPKKALEKLYKYLNKDGIIFIQDEDDGMNVVYPEDQFFADCFYIWDHSYESGDRRMGRKLPQLLKEVGFKDIKIKSTTISSIDHNGMYQEAIWDMYFNSDLWVASSQEHFNNTKALEKCIEYKKKQPKYREEYLKGKYFITLGIFFVVAKK